MGDTEESITGHCTIRTLDQLTASEHLLFVVSTQIDSNTTPTIPLLSPVVLLLIYDHLWLWQTHIFTIDEDT